MNAMHRRDAVLLVFCLFSILKSLVDLGGKREDSGFGISWSWRLHLVFLVRLDSLGASLSAQATQLLLRRGFEKSSSLLKLICET